MELTSQEKLSYDNIGGGAAREKFDDALFEALQNIQDPNTSHKKPRKIIMTVSLLPSEGRGEASVTVEVKTKLAAPRSVLTTILIGQNKGAAIAHEINQLALFPQLHEKGNVTTFETIKKGEV